MDIDNNKNGKGVLNSAKEFSDGACQFVLFPVKKYYN